MNSKQVVRSQQRKKLYAIAQFGNKCHLCGYDRCIDALEFHHMLPESKKASASYVIMRWSWDRAFQELKKCILICANCHRELHSKQKNYTLEDLPSTVKTQCLECKKEFLTTNKTTQSFCSSRCAQLYARVVKQRPSHTELTLLLQNNSFCAVGRMFNVSDNAIRKWLKQYESSV